MTFTYDLSLIATTALYQVRMLIGDTDATDQQLQDEEITFLLADCGTTRYAAVEAANTIAAHYGRQVDKSVGDLKIQASQRQKSYLDLAQRLRRRAIVGNVTPYAGGITESDKDLNRDNTDVTVPFFNREQFELPGVGLPVQSTDPLQTGSTD